jgi:hypothetical protein
MIRASFTGGVFFSVKSFGHRGVEGFDNYAWKLPRGNFRDCGVSASGTGQSVSTFDTLMRNIEF